MSSQLKSTWAPVPSTKPSQPCKIGTDFKGERIVYPANKAIIIREIEKQENCFQYNEHTAPTTVARFSPSGYYVASGDNQGNVRIWDCAGEDKILKNQVTAISGRITDLDWDGDSQRIIAVGEGKERYGHAFTADSGNSVGEIFGHSSVVNAVSLRKSRPFRAATASDDNSINFFHGTPYRFNRSLRVHSKFVYDVRYSPNDERFASAGADGKVYVFDGKTGDQVYEIDAHKGSIFSISWSPDSSQFITSSADYSCKIWDANTGSLIREWLSSDKKQLVGTVWPTKDLIIVVNSKGNLTYLNPSDCKVIDTIYGHQRSITAATLSPDATHFYTASYDGTVLSWDIGKQKAFPLVGESHTNQVMQMIMADDHVITIGMDDTLRVIDIKQGCFAKDNVFPTGYQPIGVCSVEDCLILVTVSDIQVLRSLTGVSTAKTIYQPSAVASHPLKSEFCVGGEDCCVYIHTLEKGELCEVAQCKDSTAPITCLAYSPDGKYLACGDASGKVVLYDANSREVITSRWAFHTGRILGMSWNAKSTHLATASLDTNIHIYSVERPDRKSVV